MGKPRPGCLGSGCVLRCVSFWISKKKGLGLLFPPLGSTPLLGRNCQDLTGFQQTPCSARLGQVTRVIAVSASLNCGARVGGMWSGFPVAAAGPGWPSCLPAASSLGRPCQVPGAGSRSRPDLGGWSDLVCPEVARPQNGCQERTVANGVATEHVVIKMLFNLSLYFDT